MHTCERAMPHRGFGFQVPSFERKETNDPETNME